MEGLREKIEKEVKETVGYKEAENKDSFMTGVSVTFTRASEIYEKDIEKLKGILENYKSSFISRDKDLRTISNILNKYSDD